MLVRSGFLGPGSPAFESPAEETGPFHLPVPSMHPPPAMPEKLIALTARGADRVLMAALRRLFLARRPPTEPAAFERMLTRLERYTNPALLVDPDQVMPAPERAPRLMILQQQPLRRVLASGGRESGFAEHARFTTPYAPLDPEYAAEFTADPELHDVHVWSWRHREPARASLLLTHGWGVGPWWMHRFEYDVPYLFHRLGLDVYFYLAPYHGRRKPARARFSGELHPSPDLVRSNEAFIQTVIELRAVISAILARNEAPLGMMGSSLGGYTSALLASIDDRLDFVIPVMPPASLAHLFWDHGEGDPVRRSVEQLGMTRERYHQLWSLHSPLSYTPKVPWDRRMIVTALGDTVVTAEHTRDLWEHWDRPRHFRFPGGHAWQLRSSLYHREVGRFLRELGLI